MQAIRIYFRVLGDTGNGKLVLVGTVKIQIPFNHNEVLKGALAYSRPPNIVCISGFDVISGIDPSSVGSLIYLHCN